jgi:hypothetical protein
MSEPFIVEVEHGQRRFRFQLNARELEFGAAGRAPCFWMDGRQFRGKSLGPNFRACIDLWWTAVEVAGAADDDDNLTNLVFAECFSVVNTARTLQEIYRDAQLHRNADRQFAVVKVGGQRRVKGERTQFLANEEVLRLQQLAARRDAKAIRAELEGLFLGELPSAEEMPAYRKDAEDWIGKGISAFRTAGHAGLRNHVNTVGRWIQKYRKQGNRDRHRRFVNMFSYECKVSLYLCYAAAWVGLIQQLDADRRLNETGKRFMQLWHHQNQPTEDESAKPGGNRDAFCGQVLALHPLSGIVMNDPRYLITIGRWLAHPDYQLLHRSNRVASCPEYWENVVATILVAAHEYEHSRERWEATRGNVAFSDSNAVARAKRDDGEGSAALLFEDFAAKRKLRCLQCGLELTYSSYAYPEEGEGRVLVAFRCRNGHDRSVCITEEEMLDSDPTE